MKDTKQKTLPNGFRLVTDEDTDSRNIEMLKIAIKRRKNYIRNKKNRKHKKK